MVGDILKSTEARRQRPPNQIRVDGLPKNRVERSGNLLDHFSTRAVTSAVHDWMSSKQTNVVASSMITKKYQHRSFPASRRSQLDHYRQRSDNRNEQRHGALTRR